MAERTRWYGWYRQWRMQRRARREALAAQKAELARRERIQRVADACADQLMRQYVAEHEHAQRIQRAVDEALHMRGW